MDSYIGIEQNYTNLYKAVALLQTMCHAKMGHWWLDLETQQPVQRNVGELLALIHSEISEALEGHRKNLMDDKIITRPMIEVELADAVIRIADLAGGLELDLAGALVEKMQYNEKSEDHTREARLGLNGKRY